MRYLNMRLKIVAALLLVFLLIPLSGCSATPRVTALADVTEPNDEGYYQCLYGDVVREFTLYVPDGAGENSPLIFMLHGYGDSSNKFAASTGMNVQADKYGFVVVYPQGIQSPLDKTGASGWNNGLDKNGNDDAGFLISLAQYLQKTYGYSKKYTFVSGFSNGAFMAYTLAASAPSTFSAVASVAGTMNASAWEVKTNVPLSVLQINGTRDEMVPNTGTNLGGFYGDAPGAEGLIQYWVDADKLEICETKKLSDRSQLSCYSSEKSSNLVWRVEIEGGTHSWPSESFAGINTGEIIGDFFSQCAKNK